MTEVPPWSTQTGPGVVRITLDQTPSGKEERDDQFTNDDEKVAAAHRNEEMRLRNEQFAADMANRQQYSERAYNLTQTWLGFIIVITIAQFAFSKTGAFEKPRSLGLISGKVRMCKKNGRPMAFFTVDVPACCRVLCAAHAIGRLGRFDSERTTNDN